MLTQSKLKILFIGDMTVGHCANSLVEGFKQLDVDVRSVDTSGYMRHQGIGSPAWIQRKIFKKPSESWLIGFKSSIQQLTAAWKPDVVFAINTIHVPQEIIFGIDSRIKAHLSFDDVSNYENLTTDYLLWEPHWDYIFTNKKYNVSELSTRSQAQIVYFDNAYNPSLHKLQVNFSSRKWDFGFIGACRPDRLDLPKKFRGAKVRSAIVAGPRWRRNYPFGSKDVEFLPEVLNNEYTNLGNQIKVGLCLLNSNNRDVITTRSFELPALGQLVVGQRTKEHEELLENGLEAIWLDELSEMIEFGTTILKHSRKAVRIAEAGNKRIISGKNTYRDRARSIVSYFN